jgi:DNA-binding NarL/FixJ family response regulator
MKLTRVLIVDDVAEVRYDLGIALALSGGLEIIGEAANGLEAVRLTERLNPDVVLMDLEMPVMDGYEATRLIKTVCASCRIVALTVHGYDEARKKAHRSGVDAFLIKGAQIQEIVQTIISTSRRSKE